MKHSEGKRSTVVPHDTDALGTRGDCRYSVRRVYRTFGTSGVSIHAAMPSAKKGVTSFFNCVFNRNANRKKESKVDKVLSGSEEMYENRFSRANFSAFDLHLHLSPKLVRFNIQLSMTPTVKSLFHFVDQPRSVVF